MQAILRLVVLSIVSSCAVCVGDTDEAAEATGTASVVPVIEAIPVVIPTKPKQAETVQVVWNSVFGMSVPPPDIYWIEGKELNCGSGQGFLWGEICVYGLTWRDGRRTVSQVAFDSAPFRKPGNTVLVHELCHAMLWETTGGLDGQHLTSCFKPGGLGEQAVSALKAAGLY